MCHPANPKLKAPSDEGHERCNIGLTLGTILGQYRGYIGRMENDMETTIYNELCHVNLLKAASEVSAWMQAPMTKQARPSKLAAEARPSSLGC